MDNATELPLLLGNETQARNKENGEVCAVFLAFAFCYISLERGIHGGNPPGEDLCGLWGLKTKEPPGWWISTDFLPTGADVHSCFLPCLLILAAKCTFFPAKTDPACELAPSIYSGSTLSFAMEVQWGCFPQWFADRLGISWAPRSFMAGSTVGPSPWSPLKLLRYNLG